VAKVKLSAGETLDVLTADELRQVLAEYASGFLRPAQTVRPAGGIQLDGSGNSPGALGLRQIYEIDPGYVFRLHRAGFFPDGSTFGVPFVSAAGFLEIRRGGIAVDGRSFSSPGLPLVWSAGTADGIEYRNGDAVEIFVSGGPASVNLSVRLQGTLEPVVDQ
jgi:hypothetical protein